MRLSLRGVLWGPAIQQLLKALILPPASLILAALAGVLLSRPRRRGAAALALVALLGLYILSTPLAASALLRGLESAPPLRLADAAEAQAIVVLAAGFDAEAPEYGGPTVDALALQRLRYAARLARQTGLPLLAAGGPAREVDVTLAAMMATTLERDFGVTPRWLEERSADTHQNAVFAAEILRAAGVSRILLVTHAWHMPRAQAAFERAGLAVTPAPTGRTAPPRSALALLPSAGALRQSYYALHELAGRLWYRLAYGGA